jgi:hypothetical protein
VRQVDGLGVRGDVADDGLDNADELVDEAVVGEQRHVLESAAHGDNLLPPSTMEVDVKNRQGPMPTPRWHQPCRRILSDATPCVISTRRSFDLAEG